MRRTAEDAEKTRVAILESGIRVFARAGFAKATLEAIGAEAGLTRGAIYHHFRDKRDLYARILELQAARLDALVAEALAVDLPPLRRLEALLGAVVDNFYGSETFRQFVEMTWYRLEPDMFEPVMEGKSSFVEAFLERMEALLREGIASGEVRPGTDTRRSAYHLSCLINGFYRLYHVAPRWAREREPTRQVFAEYLDTLRTSKESA